MAEPTLANAGSNQSPAMITITVNNKQFTVPGQNTVLATLRRLGFEIPTLCHLDGIGSPGACRMCLVEIEGMRNLQAACTAPVTEGMKLYTNSLRVQKARKLSLELLIANHPDCLTCQKNGNCDLQKLAEQYGIKERRFKQIKQEPTDSSAPSYLRDNTKCILCERCVAICQKHQGINAITFIGRGNTVKIGHAFSAAINDSVCIQCGQCVVHCPTGALVEHEQIEEVITALNNKEKMVIVQTAPSVQSAIGEAFGLAPGTPAKGKLVAALKKIGFAKVIDTAFGADLTIMEEGTELLGRIQKYIKGESVPLPQLTSCCPGWVNYVEKEAPYLFAHLSTAKSPHMMLGAIIKAYYAKQYGVAKEKIVMVSIMPCTAKKYEAKRPEMQNDNVRDVDYVLTTRELAKLIKRYGINFASLADEEYDDVSGTGAGDIFGVTGGVMEAALRTAYEKATGKALTCLEFHQIRGLAGVKEGKIIINEVEIKFAVVSGLANALPLLEAIKTKTSPYHFIEVMACPGGCINGGGQPLHPQTSMLEFSTILQKRMEALYQVDKNKSVRKSYENPHIIQLYKDFLGAPLSEKAHKYLHTHYVQRPVSLSAPNE
ncbi:MAG: NADH-dependent [FeFe] hydrogenase, group A6 [Candidatus Woesearchaeota archaeon]